MKLVAFADTHGFHEGLVVPDGDILVFAGDMCMRGEMTEVSDFAVWFNALPHKHKIIIAGNHDWAFYDHGGAARGHFDATYLEDDSIMIDRLCIYGSPWTPEFCGWAFMLARGDEIKAKWDAMLDCVDILISHGPPLGMLDKVRGEHVGCWDLKGAVERVKPKLHIFGHLHSNYGVDDNKDTVFANVSMLDDNYGYNDRVPLTFDI